MEPINPNPPRVDFLPIKVKDFAYIKVEGLSPLQSVRFQEKRPVFGVSQTDGSVRYGLVTIYPEDVPLPDGDDDDLLEPELAAVEAWDIPRPDDSSALESDGEVSDDSEIPPTTSTPTLTSLTDVTSVDDDEQGWTTVVWKRKQWRGREPQPEPKPQPKPKGKGRRRNGGRGRSQMP
jgi:hypothetical protein